MVTHVPLRLRREDMSSSRCCHAIVVIVITPTPTMLLPRQENAINSHAHATLVVESHCHRRQTRRHAQMAAAYSHAAIVASIQDAPLRTPLSAYHAASPPRTHTRRRRLPSADGRGVSRPAKAPYAYAKHHAGINEGRRHTRARRPWRRFCPYHYYKTRLTRRHHAAAVTRASAMRTVYHPYPINGMNNNQRNINNNK